MEILFVIVIDCHVGPPRNGDVVKEEEAKKIETIAGLQLPKNCRPLIF